MDRKVKNEFLHELMEDLTIIEVFNEIESDKQENEDDDL